MTQGFIINAVGHVTVLVNPFGMIHMQKEWHIIWKSGLK